MLYTISVLDPLYRKAEEKADDFFRMEKIYARYQKDYQDALDFVESKAKLRSYLELHGCNNVEEYIDKYDPDDNDQFWSLKDDYEDYIYRFTD